MSARLVMLLASLALVTSLALADPGDTRESFDIGSRVPALKLHLEHAPSASGKARGVVLLLHGNFFPASSSFGVDLPGGSVIARLAAAGLSVYTLDLRGYGGSTRPGFMDAPIGDYVSFASAADALDDLTSALAFIRKREHVRRVSLVGWSWGAALVGEFAGKHPEDVDKLVLYAPGWLSEAPRPAEQAGSYRTLDRVASRARVLNGVPAERVEEIHPSAWFDRWWELNLRFDAGGAAREPPVVRAPSGVTEATRDYWSKNKAPWDPRRVRAATLVIVGEWDRNTPVQNARDVHGLLTRAASRELVVLQEATHFAVLEKGRHALIAAFERFLTVQ